MNSKGASILLNPHPCGHIIYPYTDEGLVGQAVALFASAGIRDDEGVILIMAKEHCESIKLRLQTEGINPDTYERSGQLVCVTAEETLEKFMRDGLIDEDRFRITIGELIKKVKVGLTSGKVRVFGEMVSQLRGKNIKATTRLEELWNEIIDKHSAALLCTYALHGADDQIPSELMDLHSDSIQREPVA